MLPLPSHIALFVSGMQRVDKRGSLVNRGGRIDYMAYFILLLLVSAWLAFSQDVPGTIEGLAGALPTYAKTASESALQGPRRVLSAGVGGFYFTEPTGK